MRVFSVIAIIATTMLGGCAFSDTVRSTIATKGADAADDLLESSEWAVCEAAPFGAIKRRYGGSSEKWAALNTLCSNAVPATRAVPPIATVVVGDP